MECQILVQKHRKQFDVLDAAPERAFDLSSRAAARMEVVVWDWRVTNFLTKYIVRL